MKKIIYGAAMFAALFSTPVIADDFSGFYLGLGTGASVQVDKLTAGAVSVNGAGGDGYIGRVQGGYDRQFGWLVAGLSADFDFTNNCVSVTSGSSYSACLDNKWAVGARAGASLLPSTLFFVDGGFTQASFSGPSGGNFGTDSGYYLGSGVEGRLWNSNWWGKIEYRFNQFDSMSVATGLTMDPREHDVIFSIAYKFGGSDVLEVSTKDGGYKPLK